MMPMSARVAVDELVELLLANEGARGRQSLFDLQALLREDDRRVRQPSVFEARRAGELVEAGDNAFAVVLGGEFAGRMAGADAQLQHDRRVARLRQFEAFFHRAHDRWQIGARVEQPHRGFQRIGVGTLLDDAGAFAIVLTQDDHGAADDAGRREVRQGIGSDVGADDRFPGHCAAQRIVDRCAEHGGGGRFVRAGLQMHAQIGHDVFGVDQNVEQMRHRRALISADVGHARLQAGPW